MINRKLVRPNLAEIKERRNHPRTLPGIEVPAAPNGPHAKDPVASHRGGAPMERRKAAPPEQTSAEAFYYVKQMNNRTPMVVVLDDGEELRGHIEWYDRGCIKLNREDGPNLVIYKHSIKYLLKADELRDGANPT
ncbi:MAG TPA: RNA chaperone Hfq [Candidatus Polarisedimenticolaceae bacterium]|nr:RNA chaperone Hfq [Candidatus Polarisedimenticolaceae bacterium]